MDSRGRDDGSPHDDELVTISTPELAALRDRERQLRTIFEHAGIGIRLGDPQGRAVQSNRALSRMLGYSASELRGLSYTAFTLPEDAPEDVRFHEELFRGERTQYKREKRYVHKDGHIVWGSLTVSLVLDDDGKPQFIVGMVEDITERKRAQDELQLRDAQLQQSQKMEAVGQLAGGIAHDFNNLLTVIHSYSELVLADLQPEDPARADIQEIRLASERAADLTRQLLAFSRRQVLRPALLEISDVINGLEQMLRRLLGEDVRLRTVFEPAECSLRAFADRGQLEQVIVNLAVNARDAMPGGGDLTLSLRHAVLDARYAQTHPGSAAGAFIAIGVADSGLGMTDDVRKRMFEPFFTTKPVGKGTGLGLAVVYGIVKQSGGYIEVESEVARGTTFTIFLPEVKGELVAPSDSAAQPRAELRPNSAILLVEDDATVRTVAARILREEGYIVHEAEQGRDALLMVQRADVRFDLVLTDLVMPEMGGRELIEALAGSERPPRALFMTGYTEDDTLRRGVLPAGTSVLEKPFTPAVLLERVHSALRG
ncbi:MAG: PAS domain S-box protein [Gemmatimonadaceae bacterium]|nr:PAS domain S-box protein [Gemmatimonadaceae bacterium]